MCVKTPKAPDTSAADAERQRQYDADRTREDGLRAKREEEASRQREADIADREAWEQEQRDVQAQDELRRQEEAGARQREEQEARRIAEQRATEVAGFQTGRSERENALRAAIDQAFAGYNDEFFNKYTTDYVGSYKPQVEQQAQEARRKATLALAERGNLQSTAGARTLADIEGQRAAEEARIAREAQSSAANYRTSILDQRRALLDRALSASVLGDPSVVPEELVGALRDTDARIADFTPTISTAAKSIAAPAGGSLGDLFGNLVPEADAPATAATQDKVPVAQASAKKPSTTVVNDPETKKTAAASSPLYAGA